MGRLALYRTYRPNDLADVVGQQHITDTLEKALAGGRMSHAYLLTGPRGVGKTSVARILARRINELPADVDLSSELDLIEIDAASNRGIDEIRSLREKISTLPSRLKYKVFIIDEVHMLTREAFNALLKTLEEPPAHAIFILATTEIHKIPDTIISRTQRHDFRLITPKDLAAHLQFVATEEKIEADPAALELVAELAHGGFRDALSLLDQLASRGETITLEIVAGMAGVGDRQKALKIIALALQGDFSTSLNTLHELLTAGAEPTILTGFLLSRTRLALIDKSQEPTLKDLDTKQVIRVLDALSLADREQRTASIPALPLELALWKISGGVIDQSTAAPTAAAVAETSAPAPATKAAAPKPPAGGGETGLNSNVITTKALSLIKIKNNSLYAVLRSGEPSLEGNVLIVRCRFRFHKERIEEHKNQTFIEAVFSKVAGRPIELRVQHTGADQSEAASNEEGNEDLVASALEILGGEVIE